MGSMKNSSPDQYKIRNDLGVDLENKENQLNSSIIGDISDKLRNVFHRFDGNIDKKIGGKYTEIGFGIPGNFKFVTESQDGPQTEDLRR